MCNTDIFMPGLSGVKLWFCQLLAALVFFFCGSAEAAVPDSWKQTAYAYDAHNTPLSQALKEFANTFGVRANVESVEGVLNGRFRADNAQDYLERLALEYNFQWFLYNGTLYVSSIEEYTSANIAVSEDSIGDLKGALGQVGLLDERFGWGELPDEGMVMVSGPKKYIGFIRTAVKNNNKDSDEKRNKDKDEVMVFPLVYASVTDRQIQYRNQSVLLPGVVTILSDLLSKGSGGPTAYLESLAQGAGQRVMEKIESDNGMYNTEPVEEKSASTSNKISADVRNNAVLIFDKPEKRPIFERLIAKLDVPRNLVEIDAVIFDIDRSKISDLGVQWEVSEDGVDASVDPTGGIPFLGGGSAATIVISDFRRFLTRIRALESNGSASLVASPSILTIENQPAVIDFNDTSYITVTGERVAQVQEVTAGTSLRVVPRVIHRGEDDKLIQLSVDIEDGKLSETNNAESPTVSRGTISTQAVISASRSLVVGGFHVAKDGDQVQKVPVLGDIPLFGKLFKFKSQAHSKRERLFIISPRLMGNEVDPTRYVNEKNSPAYVVDRERSPRFEKASYTAPSRVPAATRQRRAPQQSAPNVQNNQRRAEKVKFSARERLLPRWDVVPVSPSAVAAR